MKDMSWGQASVKIANIDVGECREGGVRVLSEPGASKEVYATGGRLVAYSQAEPKITIEADAFASEFFTVVGSSTSVPVEISTKNGSVIRAEECAVTAVSDYTDDSALVSKFNATVVSGFSYTPANVTGDNENDIEQQSGDEGVDEYVVLTLDELAATGGARKVRNADGSVTVLFGLCDARIGGMQGDCKQGSVQVTGTPGSMIEVYSSMGKLVAARPRSGKMVVRATYIEPELPEKLVVKDGACEIIIDGEKVLKAHGVCSFLPGYTDVEGFFVTAECVLL